MKSFDPTVLSDPALQKMVGVHGSVTAQAVAAKRNDGALEQFVGRLSLEPHVGAATWQLDRTVPEA